jgi:hypothetical protein
MPHGAELRRALLCLEVYVDLPEARPVPARSFNVSQCLSPPVEELNCVVASRDLRHRKQQVAVFVYCHPRLGIGYVQIMIGQSPPGFTVYKRIPLNPSQKQVLLLRNEQASEQIYVSLP